MEGFCNIRINYTWNIKTKIFRQSLALQANLSRKEKRPRSLGNFYEFGTFKGSSLVQDYIRPNIHERGNNFT